MISRSSIGAIAISALILCFVMHGTGASGAEPAYPNWRGQWVNPAASKDGTPWDPSKPLGRAQEPPLTQEYQAVFEASLAAQAEGAHGNNYRSLCVLDGMPRIMNLDAPMEILIRPNVTDLLFQDALPRRIFTDGRDWPDDAATFQGSSLGKWIDEDRDGQYDVLEVETRNFTGPRVFESSGLPLAKDNETIVKERLYLDKVDKNVLHDEITTIDSALTKPWTVAKTYVRNSNPQWAEYNCVISNTNVLIGTEEYAVSADGFLTPTRKGQPKPDLQFFQ